MPDRPIIFSGPMVRALLEGRKTQTRRVLNPQPDLTDEDRVRCVEWRGVIYSGKIRVPYAHGDRLYVREAHSLHWAHGQDFKRPADDHGERWGPWSGLPIAVSPDKTQVAYYREGFDRSGAPKWRPSIHMPRWASRLTLTVTDVRVQRLQDISEADVLAEGCPLDPFYRDTTVDGSNPNMVKVATAKWISPRAWYHDLWNSLHGPDAWDENPWVVAVSFAVQRGNIDQIGAAA